MFVVFLVMQKTAYEMRISDWSSDVCSSDLAGPDRARLAESDDRRRSSRPDARHPRPYQSLWPFRGESGSAHRLRTAAGGVIRKGICDEERDTTSPTYQGQEDPDQARGSAIGRAHV